MRKIKQVREKLGMTMIEFGKFLGVTPVTIHRWEHGKNKIRLTVEQYLKLSNSLEDINMKIEDLK